MSLRPHQVRTFAAVRDAIRAGRRWPLVVMPTGAGKTRLGGELATVHVKLGGRVLWLAHREELVSQAVDALSHLGLPVGCIHAGNVRPKHPEHPVQVASIQTLLSREVFPEASMLIYDEAHHAGDETGWTEVPKHYKAQKKIGIGLTATPSRADGQGLGELFDDLIVGATPRELIDAGFLVPCEVLAPSGYRGKIAALSPVEAYTSTTPGKKAICFAPHIKAAREYMDQFLKAGIPCDLVTGTDNRKLRRTTLQAFRDGKIKVLVNCGVLTEGYDDPSTEVCILARNCGSVSLYIQMVGRVMRSAPGKKQAWLLDLHGVTHKHGPPEEDREYSLEGIGIRRAALEAAPESFCQVCGALREGPGPCLDCGLVQELKIPGVLNEKLVRFEAKRRENAEQKLQSLKRWIQAAGAKGHKPGSAWHKYKAVYAEEPTREMWRQANDGDS